MATETTPTEPPREQGVMSTFAEVLERGHRIAARPDLSVGHLKMWNGSARAQLKKIYGPESEVIDLLPLVEGPPARRAPVSGNVR